MGRRLWTIARPRRPRRSPAVVAASPVVEQAGGGDRRRVAMAEELDLGRPAAHIFQARVDEPEAKLLRGARPAVDGVVELDRRVDVLVALAQVGGKVTCSAWRPASSNRTCRPASRRSGPRSSRPPDSWADARSAVGVDARIVAAEAIANLDIGRKVAAPSGTGAVAHVDAARNPFDRDFAHARRRWIRDRSDHAATVSLPPVVSCDQCARRAPTCQ